LRDFEYTAPTTLREAVKLLSEKGDSARVLAGGTDLIVQMRARRFQPERVVDIKNVPEANELSLSPRKGLRIGAAVPCQRIYNDEGVKEHFAGLTDASMIIGGIQIQGRATLGGNLCNASPSADSIPALIAYGAEAEIIGPNGKRKLPVEDFCTAPGANALQPGEMLVAIRMSMPKPNRAPTTCGSFPATKWTLPLWARGPLSNWAGAASPVCSKRFASHWLPLHRRRCPFPKQLLLSRDSRSMTKPLPPPLRQRSK
jgi:carbon-monoxide dehydrogenase medium subunit